MTPRVRPDLAPRRWADGELEAVQSACDRVLRSGRYVLGPEVDRFEAEFAALVGGRSVLGVASGTDALELALRAFDLPPGSVVLVPDNAGGYASVAALRAGLRPRPVDVDPERLLLDPEDLARRAGPDCSAVVHTHLYGQGVDLRSLRAWCDARGLVLIEDCAQAHGALTPAGPVGAFGHAAAFSFYPTKNLAALGDAGAVALEDPTAAARVRQLRQYGWRPFQVVETAGVNSRLDELQAAVLTARLPHLAAGNERRRTIALRYHAAVDPALGRVLAAAGPAFVAHQAVLVTDRRDDVQARLDDVGIDTAVRYPVPDHLMPAVALADAAGDAPLARPRAERACAQVLSLPCHPGLTDEEVDRVCDALARIESRS